MENNIENNLHSASTYCAESTLINSANVNNNASPLAGPQANMNQRNSFAHNQFGHYEQLPPVAAYYSPQLAAAYQAASQQVNPMISSSSSSSPLQRLDVSNLIAADQQRQANNNNLNNNMNMNNLLTAANFNQTADLEPSQLIRSYQFNSSYLQLPVAVAVASQQPPPAPRPPPPPPPPQPPLPPPTTLMMSASQVDSSSSQASFQFAYTDANNKHTNNIISQAGSSNKLHINSPGQTKSSSSCCSLQNNQSISSHYGGALNNINGAELPRQDNNLANYLGTLQTGQKVCSLLPFSYSLPVHLSNKSSSSTSIETNNNNNNEEEISCDKQNKSTETTTTTTSGSDERLKCYFTQLVLASNVPFAYAIILIAFLITIITASSIITILTVILTLTGYTAYPITENTFNTSLLIGVVSASFALALVTFLLIYWRRHCQAAYYYLDEPQDASRATNSPQLSETYDDTEYGSIGVSDWAKHVQKLHADSDIGFTREFEQVAGPANNKSLMALTCEHSNLAENKPKNRYTNIVAYDHTRVVLRPPLGGTKKAGYDYINANFIDGYNKPRAYIGTQGPLVSTFDDYWRMIWEQRVVIIVMITNLQERGRRKCDLYWPKEGTETYGYVQVKLLQEVVMATYTLRTFTVKNLKLKKRTGSERTVYQYHYTNWPDHGVPDHPLPVLSFVRKSAAANPPAGGAIICHCSAGCGRSGTYIVIDAMLKQIRHRQSINVVDFLKHIRAQRNFLVQTEEQYIFIHDSLVEAIESGETEIPSNLIGKYIQLLQTGGGGGGGKSSSSNYSLTNGTLISCRQSPNSLSVAATATMSNNELIAASPTNNNNNNTNNTNNNNNLLLANGTTTMSRSSSQANNNNNNNNQAQWSLLERQYRLVASFKAKDFCVVSALKPCNKVKNRTLNLIPLEAHRVHITPKAGQDGSDYINATFLMGFNHLREFIATQHPVYETYSDFWQMVYDHNSQTIVLLSQMSVPAGVESSDKDYGQFWPQKEDEVDYGSFKVKLTKESTLMKGDNGGNLIIARDFIMRSNQDDYELQTRIVHCPGWPDCCGSLSAVFDLIQVVQQATQQQASQHQMHDRHNGHVSQTVTIGQEHEPQNGGPIIVVDKFGGTEAATFATLTTLFKQINFEDAVDVYMYAKLAHLRRPGIWSSQDDYLFLYRAMEQYASNLAAQQQHQQQQVADKQAATLVAAAPPPINHHHHQTMTLDRHRHKQSSTPNSATGLKTSTMGRRKHQQHQQLDNQHLSAAQQQQQHQQNQFNQQNLQLATGHMSASSDFLVKTTNSNNPTMVPVMMDLNHNNLQYSTMGSQAKQQQLLVMQQQQHQPPVQLMSKGSPYNSAASIGAGSHQHLLAGQTPRAAAANQQHNLMASNNANSNKESQYLYSMQ